MSHTEGQITIIQIDAELLGAKKMRKSILTQMRKLQQNFNQKSYVRDVYNEDCGVSALIEIGTDIFDECIDCVEFTECVELGDF